MIYRLVHMLMDTAVNRAIKENFSNNWSKIDIVNSYIFFKMCYYGIDLTKWKSLITTLM